MRKEVLPTPSLYWNPLILISMSIGVCEQKKHLPKEERCSKKVGKAKTGTVITKENSKAISI